MDSADSENPSITKGEGIFDLRGIDSGIFESVDTHASTVESLFGGLNRWSNEGCEVQMMHGREADVEDIDVQGNIARE